MKQKTFVAGNFERYRKPIRHEQFLAEMDKVVLWDQLCAVIEPYYPKVGNGHPPIGLKRMLRIYFLQHWFNLSNPGAEEALYESRYMFRFAGIDLGGNRCRARVRFFNFAICWSAIIWATPCFSRLASIYVSSIS